jgi:S-formylglutathione hydrolase FrmB
MPAYGYLGTFKNQSYEKIINAGITEFFEFNQLFNDINTYYTISSNSHEIITKWDYTATLDEVKIWETMGFETDLSALFDNENEDTFAQSETMRKEVFLNQLSTPTIRNTIKSNMHRKMLLHKLLVRTNQEAKDIIQKIDEQSIE